MTEPAFLFNANGQFFRELPLRGNELRIPTLNRIGKRYVFTGSTHMGVRIFKEMPPLPRPAPTILARWKAVNTISVLNRAIKLLRGGLGDKRCTPFCTRCSIAEARFVLDKEHGQSLSLLDAALNMSRILTTDAPMMQAVELTPDTTGKDYVQSATALKVALAKARKLRCDG